MALRENQAPGKRDRIEQSKAIELRAAEFTKVNEQRRSEGQRRYAKVIALLNLDDGVPGNWSPPDL